MLGWAGEQSRVPGGALQSSWGALGVPPSSTCGHISPSGAASQPTDIPQGGRRGPPELGSLFSPSRIGYHIPMFLGFAIMFLSTVSEYRPPHPALHRIICWVWGRTEQSPRLREG